MTIKDLINEVVDDVEEKHCSLRDLTDDVLIDCRNNLEKRLGRVL